MAKLEDMIRSHLISHFVKQSGDEYWYHCPFHHDEHASMHINFDKGIWYCHACQPSGFEATLKGLAIKLGLLESVQDREEVLGVRTFEELVEVWHAQLLREKTFMSYLETKRALPSDIIKRAKLGLARLRVGDFLAIPIMDEEGKPQAVKFRRLERSPHGLVFSSQSPRYFWAKSSMHPLIPDATPLDVYPLHLLSHVTSDVVYITGGELDALVLWSRGKVALTSTKGELATHKLEDLVERVAGKTVILALDNEPSVQSILKDIASVLSQKAFAVYSLRPLEGLKDVTDIAVAGKLEEYLSTASFVPMLNESEAEVWIDEGKYWTREGDKAIALTSFVIKPLRWLVRDDRTQCFLEATVVTQQDRINALIPVAVFETPYLRQQWCAQLASPYFIVFSQKDKYWRSLLIHLRRTCKEYTYYVPILGLTKLDNQWVFITSQRTYPPTNYTFLDPENIEYMPFRTSEGEPLHQSQLSELRPVCETLLHIHEHSVVIPLASLFHAILLAPFIRECNVNQFPVTMVWGEAGTGKTTLLFEVFSRLIGFEPAQLIAPNQTESTLRKYTSMLSSFPLILDEFTPHRYGDEALQNARLVIHACYGQIVRQVSKDATMLERPYIARAPLILIGERSYFITKEEALAERVRLIRITQRPSGDYITALRKWEELREQGLVASYAHSLIDFIMKNESEWLAWWKEARDEVNDLHAYLDEPLTFRKLFMWYVAQFGYNIMKRFWSLIGCADLLTTNDYVHLAPTSLVSFISTPLTIFLSVLDHLASIGKAKAGEHFQVEDGNKLVIAIHKCYEEITKNLPRSEATSITPDFLKNFLINEQAQGMKYVIEAYKRIRIGGGQYYCAIVDLNELYNIYGIEVPNILNAREEGDWL